MFRTLQAQRGGRVGHAGLTPTHSRLTGPCSCLLLTHGRRQLEMSDADEAFAPPRTDARRVIDIKF